MRTRGFRRRPAIVVLALTALLMAAAAPRAWWRERPRRLTYLRPRRLWPHRHVGSDHAQVVACERHIVSWPDQKRMMPLAAVEGGR
jgi:hypothetical protein